MKDSEALSFHIILNVVKNDHAKDSNSQQSKSFKNDSPKSTDNIPNPTISLPTIACEDRPNLLECVGMKIIIFFDIIEFLTIIKVLLGLNLNAILIL